MTKQMNSAEKKLFLSVCLSILKNTVSQELKGKMLYALKNHQDVSNSYLQEAFPLEYEGVMAEIQKRPIFHFLDKTNYVFDFFFNVYNANKRTNKVMPAQIIGFKAEYKGGKKIMNAKVKFSNGDIKDSNFEVFSEIEPLNLSFNSYVLIYCNTICCVITENEYNEIVSKYFSSKQA